MFKITVLSSRNLVESKLSGAFTPATVAEYEAALRGHFTAGALRSGYHMLIDVSEATIQSQETIQAFIRHVGRMPKATGIAVLVGTSVIRMQVRRVLQQPYLRLFAERGASLEWLLAGDDRDLAA